MCRSSSHSAFPHSPHSCCLFFLCSLDNLVRRSLTHHHTGFIPLESAQNWDGKVNNAFACLHLINSLLSVLTIFHVCLYPTRPYIFLRFFRSALFCSNNLFLTYRDLSLFQSLVTGFPPICWELEPASNRRLMVRDQAMVRFC